MALCLLPYVHRPLSTCISVGTKEGCTLATTPRRSICSTILALKICHTKIHRRSERFRVCVYVSESDSCHVCVNHVFCFFACHVRLMHVCNDMCVSVYNQRVKIMHLAMCEHRPVAGPHAALFQSKQSLRRRSVALRAHIHDAQT